MTAQPAYSLRKALSHIVGDMARALAERRDETTAVRVARTNAAVHMILGFMPRDVIETVLAGHCVMFHEMIVDGVRGMFLSETAATRRSERGGIVAMDKCFINNLDRLRRSQLQPDRSRAEEAGATAVPAAAEGSARDAAIDAKVSAAMTAANIREAARFTPPPVEAVEPARDARTPAAAAMDDPSLAGLDEADTLGDEAFAAFSANPAAKTALEAGDPIAFARAMGVEEPSEEFLAAANAPGSPFDRSAARHGAPAGQATPAQPAAPRGEPVASDSPAAAR